LIYNVPFQEMRPLSAKVSAVFRSAGFGSASISGRSFVARPPDSGGFPVLEKRTDEKSLSDISAQRRFLLTGFLHRPPGKFAQGSSARRRNNFARAESAVQPALLNLEIAKAYESAMKNRPELYQ